MIVREPMHDLHGEITSEVDRLALLVLTPAPAFPDLQKVSSRKMADEFLLCVGGQAPKVAGLDDESH